MVELLVGEGADVNTTNSFGMTPMMEACHRGYMNICLMLLKSGRVDLSYIAPGDLASRSPFVSSPPQSALAEAARSGFQKIVQVMDTDTLTGRLFVAISLHCTNTFLFNCLFDVDPPRL